MIRRLLAPLLWLSVACALLLAASGCGGGSAAEGSYSNSDYGFSLAYESPLKAMTSAISPATLGVDFAYGFVDPKAGGLKDGTLTGVVVSVKGGESKQVPAHLAALGRAAWWTQASQKAAKLGDFKLLSKKEFMLNGAPARLYEGEGTNAGNRFHFKNVAIFAGNRVYELFGQCPTDAWTTTGKAVSRAIDSFTLSDDLKAIAVASEKAADSAGGTARRYANKQYRFHLRIAAGFQELSADKLPNTTQGAFAVGFADSASSSDAPGAGGQLLTGFIVQVGDLGQTLSKTQAAAALQAMGQSTSIRKDIEQGNAAIYSGMKMGGFKMTRLGGRPALTFDLTYVSSQATAQRQRVYMLISGKYMYQLQLEASQSVWNDRIGVLQRMARSFRTP